MNTKQIESLGLEALNDYLLRSFGSDRVTIKDIRSYRKYGCDAIVLIDDTQYYIEIKASMKESLPTNLRFTHQTLATMHNEGVLDQMIVAFIYNLAKGIEKAKFAFFRFGDIDPKHVIVEPHFIIKPKSVLDDANEDGDEEPSKKQLLELLRTTPDHLNIDSVFDTKVRQWMNLNTDDDRGC